MDGVPTIGIMLVNIRDLLLQLLSQAQANFLEDILPRTGQELQHNIQIHMLLFSLLTTWLDLT
jgi:hypothetical protein